MSYLGFYTTNRAIKLFVIQTKGRTLIKRVSEALSRMALLTYPSFDSPLIHQLLVNLNIQVIFFFLVTASRRASSSSFHSSSFSTVGALLLAPLIIKI